jgi:glycyl-tRNA synthetase (class II)
LFELRLRAQQDRSPAGADSLDDNAVKVRDRDTMGQERVPLAELQSYLGARLVGA